MTYFKTYENCIITFGITRSLISDLQFGNSEFIPNSMAEIIQKLNNNLSIESLLKEYDKDDMDTIKEYLQFLEKKNFGQYCDSHDILCFSPLEKKFYFPEEISNVIIECGQNLTLLYDFLSQNSSFYCKNLCLVFYECLEEKDFLQLKEIITDSNFLNLEIVVKYNSHLNEEFIRILGFEFAKLSKLHIHSAPFNKEVLWEGTNLIDIIFSMQVINTFKACGIVKMEHFGVNIQKYTESFNHNSCLHKKISIDSEGNIRNCPSMPQNFGNIKDTTLEKALAHPDFKKYWNLTKDKIEVCKDCEFRYICTDCRAYTERTHTDAEGLDISKPLKCGYNPHTGEWQEWSTNPLKEKAINYYKMEELIKK